MKRLLLSCIVLLSGIVASFAQSTPPPLDVATPVSKAEYVAKVTALNNAVLASNMTLAETIFGQVTTLITDEMKVSRYMLRDATTEAEKNTARNIIKNQRQHFSIALTQKQGGMVPNRAAMIAALNDFGATFD